MIYVITASGASRFAVLFCKERPEVEACVRARVTVDAAHNSSTTRLPTGASQLIVAAQEFACTAPPSKLWRKSQVSSSELVG